MSIESIENDLARLVAKHPTISGAEFLRAAEQVAEGYYEADDLADHDQIKRIGESLKEALWR